MMDRKVIVFLSIAVLPIFTSGLRSCSSDEIRCRSGDQCVKYRYVCTGDGNHCNDGSDEDPRICEVWQRSSHCSIGQRYCDGYCNSFRDFCISSSCKSDSSENKNFCKLIDSGTLNPPEEGESGMALTEEMVDLVQKAVDISSNSTEYCPMFYTRVGENCLSFFSPAKIPWPEARQFCLSIGGDLVSIGSIVDQDQLLEYMRKAHLTTSYWTGGRFDVDTNAWSWVYNDAPMPLGSPFWATKYSSSCVPRSPPHTDPYSSPASPLPGAPCYNYVQAPSKRSPGWCAAMTYEHFYYFTDEMCRENLSPLCFFTGEFTQFKKDSSLQ